MGDYSVQQLAAAASQAGFTGFALVQAVAISLAEDTGMSLRAQGRNTDGSVDRGPWQFNSRWHPEVSDSCAYDLNCAAREAFRVSQQGKSWSPWATFSNGRYRQFLGQAQGVAGAAASGPTALPGGLALPDPNAIGNQLGGAVTKFSHQLVAALQVAGGGLLVLVGAYLLVSGKLSRLPPAVRP